MRLGTSWCLLTIGAVLAFAVDVDLAAVDLAAVGRILVLVGVGGAVVELALVRPRARAAREARAAKLAAQRQRSRAEHPTARALRAQAAEHAPRRGPDQRPAGAEQVLR